MEASKRLCYRSCQKKVTPFSPELREFIANSRKSQTLYFNCEGTYRRRVVKKGEEDCLSDYIYNTLYHEGAHTRSTETDTDKIKHVESMLKLMCCSSKLYDSDGEVHFTVVWVYYFHYGRKERMALPVFKIYKSKLKNDAVFLDIDLNSYESWNCYVESADFPESFLCVPRNGEYYFDREENKLDLEFLSCSRIDSVGHPRQSASPKKSFFPYSCHVIRLRIKVEKLRQNLKEKVRSFVAFLCNLWRKYNRPIKCAIVFAFIAAVKCYAPEMVSQPLSQYALMFLNSRMESERQEELLNPSVASCSNVPQSLPQESPAEKSEVRELLRQKEKNWNLIFKVICSFLLENRDDVLLALNCLLSPYAVKIANVIFSVAKAFDESKLLNPDNNLTVESNADVSFEKASTSRSLVQSLEANHASVNQNPLKLNPDKNLEPAVHENSVSFEKASNSGYLEKRENFAFLDQKPGSGGDAGIVEGMSLEKLWAVFCSLETDCASEIQNKAKEYHRRTPPTLTASQLHKFWKISDVDELSVVFMTEISVPRLIANIRHLLRKDFRLEPTAESTQLIILDFSGNEMGIVFFPLNSIAICIFRLEFMKIELME